MSGSPITILTPRSGIYFKREVLKDLMDKQVYGVSASKALERAVLILSSNKASGEDQAKLIVDSVLKKAFENIIEDESQFVKKMSDVYKNRHINKSKHK
tara:strand:+ start:640 stop:936 length:297 start_codon:yes stop_codon:yes gene_type:complete